jgi:hypothetical protein
MSGLRMECVCDLCRVVYQPWYADNDLWNAVLDPTHDRESFLCPTCFVGLAHAHNVVKVARVTWHPTQRGDQVSGGMDMTEPSSIGKVLDQTVIDGRLHLIVVLDAESDDPEVVHSPEPTEPHAKERPEVTP